MSNNYIFLKPITKNSNSFIKINFISKKNKIIPVDDFIKTYKISNFWKGKYFIKKLINRIFKYKLNSSMKWNNKIWDVINIYQFIL